MPNNTNHGINYTTKEIIFDNGKGLPQGEWDVMIPKSLFSVCSMLGIYDNAEGGYGTLKAFYELHPVTEDGTVMEADTPWDTVEQHKVKGWLCVTETKAHYIEGSDLDQIVDQHNDDLSSSAEDITTHAMAAGAGAGVATDNTHDIGGENRASEDEDASAIAIGAGIHDAPTTLDYAGHDTVETTGEDLPLDLGDFAFSTPVIVIKFLANLNLITSF